MHQYTIEDLYETFKSLRQMETDKVAGVIKLTGKDPTGPTLGITVCTHGNEPCGLAAVRHLLEKFPDHQIERGQLYLIINNLSATQRFFTAAAGARSRWRSVTLNMNRLPTNPYEKRPDNSELRRVRELRSIFERLEFGLDIHSTSQDMGPMLVGVGREIPTALTRGFPMDRFISNIDKVQIGSPVCTLYGRPSNPAQVLGIECGQHESPLAFERAIQSAESLLMNLEMIEGQTEPVREHYEEYKVWGSVIFPNKSYRLNGQFDNFEFLRAGYVLAVGNGPDMVMPRDGHALFAGPSRDVNDLTEEVMFLTKPMRQRQI